MVPDPSKSSLGLEYFCKEIFPRVRARRPQTTLSIVGANADPDAAQKFTGEGIHLLGQVPDIREPLSSHTVFVCPIRLGAGVRVKILEAFASGIPVVSTSLGAEGLAVRSGEELLLADDPGRFANACLQLLEQPHLAGTIASNARQLVETRYDWPIVAAKLEQVYRELVRQRGHSLPANPAGPAAESPASLVAR